MKKPKRKKSELKEAVKPERVLLVPSDPHQPSDYRLVAVFNKNDSVLPIRLEVSDYAESVYISLSLSEARHLAKTLTKFCEAMGNKEISPRRKRG